MIDGLMTKSEFMTASEISWNWRWKSLEDVDTAVEAAHKAVGADNQYAALLEVSHKVYLWKVDYKAKKDANWTASRRADGIRALERQIGTLFATTYLAQNTAFRLKLHGKLTRAKENFKKITGVGMPGRGLHFPGQLRTLSSQDYVFEFLEPKHRANATQLSHMWLEAEGDLSFREYVNSLGDEFLNKLDDMNGKVRVDGEDKYKWVQYLSAEERVAYELMPVALNKFRRDLDEGSDFHTGNHESEPSKAGWSIFVMDEANHIYSNSKVVKYFHHSSFLSGGPTKSAGTLRVDRGRITHITMASGHYAPGRIQALAILRALLVKFVAHAARDLAQAELDDVLICPDFQQVEFYEGLKYLMAGGDTAGLTKHAFPTKLLPIVEETD